jgi:hypothetical protein
MKMSFLFVSLCSVSLVGCAAFSPNDVANPSRLSVENAMKSIGQGFNNMQEALDGGKMGLWPCKVVTTLNVTASAEEGGSLVLDTTIKPPATSIQGEMSGHIDQKNTSLASRRNAVTIEMYSAACLPEHTIGYDKPDQVKDVVEGLNLSREKSPLIVEPSEKQMK